MKKIKLPHPKDFGNYEDYQYACWKVWESYYPPSKGPSTVIVRRDEELKKALEDWKP